MTPDEAHAHTNDFIYCLCRHDVVARVMLEKIWALRGSGHLGSFPSRVVHPENEPLCALLRTKTGYHIVEGDPGAFWTVKKALWAVADSKYEITAANYYKIYQKGIPEDGVVNDFLEEYFGPVPCGGRMY